MLASCNRCNYRSREHWSLKGVAREVNKTAIGFIPNEALAAYGSTCPVCARQDTLKIRSKEKKA